MLRVAIELHPFGDSSQKKEIGEIFIANMGDSAGYPIDGTWCEYNVWRERPTKKTMFKPDASVSHRREDGAEELVRLCLNALHEDDDERE